MRVSPDLVQDAYMEPMVERTRTARLELGEILHRILDDAVQHVFRLQFRAQLRDPQVPSQHSILDSRG